MSLDVLADQAELTIAVAQYDFVVGDVKGNAQRIIDQAIEAHQQGADIFLTPELALSGYPAEDAYLRPSFIYSCQQQLERIAKALAHLSDFALVVGHPTYSLDLTFEANSKENHSLCYNAASVLVEGQIKATYAKQYLPYQHVFDEPRYFEAGKQKSTLWRWKSFNIALLICEDIWHPKPCLWAKEQGADLVMVLNASPFHLGKAQQREALMCEQAKIHQLALVYAHGVGGQDELIFDGNSFAVSSTGQIQARAPAFKENTFYLTLFKQDLALHWKGPCVAPIDDDCHNLWQALVLGVKDYVSKNQFSSVCLGLSGGIDSALVLAIAVDALGPERVTAWMMPSAYTSDISLMDAKQMAHCLNVRYQEKSIQSIFEHYTKVLGPNGFQVSTTQENVQARIRGMFLMALSNETGALVLTTGNKSELATGYCTLYGDMAGGFAVIKDLLKTQVFELARWRNAHDPFQRGASPIPPRIIERPPSAELRPDQLDQDTLPPYEILDAILKAYIEDNSSQQALIEQGYSAEMVQQVIHLLHRNEYKRRQAPVGIRVSSRAFGRDWRYPITYRFF